MRWRHAWVAVVGLGVGCSHVRDRLEVAVATDDGPVACTTGACATGACADNAKVCKHPTVHALASDLDHLQKHIECYGSVVAKVPDVWGQARLTQYRQDFEKEMVKDLDQFEFGLQGNYSRSDQSYLSFALSLGMAVQPKPPVIGSVTTGAKSASLEAAKSDVVLIDRTPTGLAGSLTDLVPPTPAKKPDPVKTPDAPDVKGVPDGVFKRNDAGLTTVKFAAADKGIGIEPAERLAQKKRYLDLLAQFRRENEGGDTADAPGYQLNLIRLPVSVLPGSHTDRGHGAEVTFTLDPILGDDLLPTTFRRMAVNDVVEQFGLPLTDALYDDDTVKQLTPAGQKTIRLIARFYDLLSLDPTGERAKKLAGTMTGEEGKAFEQSTIPTKAMKSQVREWRGEAPDPVAATPGTPTPAAAAPNKRTFAQTNLSRPSDADPTQPVPGVRKPTPVNSLLGGFTLPSLSFSTGLDNKLPFPTSQLVEVYGEAFLYEIALASKVAIVPDANYRGYFHLPDVQSFLKHEMIAAHNFLAKNPHLLTAFADPALVQAVHSRDTATIFSRRTHYREQVRVLAATPPADETAADLGRRPPEFSVTAALAWCLIVDSAMLTDRLVRDMRESATARGLAPLVPADAWPCVFLPDPPADARSLFNAYVKMRWPVYVFALDPAAQEQNIADSLSTRRETQLALAVAFANGAMNAKSFLTAARRLEAEAQTVGLNRTQVGFAHGDNTFGWRFYPRFQTMPTQTHLTVLVRDQLIGGPTANAVLRQRRLEPGPRECVALVVMPSFVPYVTIDAVSNWFRLPDPKCKLLDHTQAMRLSKTVKTLERCEHAVTDADCYRDGELKRLQTRVKQLADRLPAQTLTAPVPILDTLGGFELFSNGTTDLAPQLFGFYGAPGIAADKPTTVFLVGDHFSPLRSKVVVGSLEVEARLLSRQVMQVTVPAGAMVVTEDKPGGKKLKWAHAHVATPYGVSREVYIPVLDAKPADPAAAPKAGYSVPDKTTLTVRYGQAGTDPTGQHFVPCFQGVEPQELKLAWSDPLGLAPAHVQVRLTFKYGDATLVVPCVGRVMGTTRGGKADGPPYDPPAGTTPTEADKEKTPQLVIDHPNLTLVGQELVRQIAAKPIPYAGNPLADGLTSTGVFVTPVPLPGGGQTPTEVKANGQLKVAFVAMGPCAPPVILTPTPHPGGLPAPGTLPAPVMMPGTVPPANLGTDVQKPAGTPPPN